MQLMYQLISAVSFMHRNGVFHCDTKENNILMYGSRAVLADFGMAAYRESNVPNYYRKMDASPEVLIAHYGVAIGSLTGIAYGHLDDIDPRLFDVWAVGLICLYVLTGSSLVTPFDNISKVMVSFYKNPRVGLEKLRVPEEWMVPLMRMLDPDYRTRLVDLAEVLRFPIFAGHHLTQAVDGLVVGTTALVYPVPLSSVQIPAINTYVSIIFELRLKGPIHIATIFAAVDLYYRLAQVMTGYSPELLALAAFYLAAQLYMHQATFHEACNILTAYTKLRKTGIAALASSQVTEQQLTETAYRCTEYLHGVLYHPTLYTYAFSLLSLFKVLYILGDIETYAQSDPRAEMVRLAAEETDTERNSRHGRAVSWGYIRHTLPDFYKRYPEYPQLRLLPQ